MQNKTFRLFISSTFSDLKEERNILQNEVFPEVKSYCKSFGYGFEPIDLRWGVSNEAGLDHKAMEICINEVEKIFNYPRPNFLIMLGNRYGWIPVPTEIEKSEFEKILDYVKKNNEDTVIEYWEHDEKSYPKVYGERAKGKVQAPNRTTNHIELLEQWYKLDDNQLPASYILQEREENKKYENYLIYENWGPEEDALREILQKAVSNIDLIEKENKKYEKYFLSATEHEIMKGVLESAKRMHSADDNVLCMVRNIENIDEVDDNIFLDEDQTKLESLKIRLKECEIPNVQYSELSAKLVQKESELKPDKDYLESYAILVKKFLKEHIKNEIKRLDKEKVQLEHKTHEKFKTERANIFVGRSEIIESVSNYIENVDISNPYVIYGESGVGKSALIAKIITEIEKNYHKDEIGLLYRFVGISEVSSQPKLFLDDLIFELEKMMGIYNEKIPKDYSESVNRFISLLNDFSQTNSKRLILIIDALDQFEIKTNLEWIEAKLPRNIKIIVSTLPSEYGEYYNILKTKVPSKHIKEVTKLTIDDGQKIIESWLEIHNKKLTEDQFNHILELFKENGLPLYLKIIFDQALRWRSYDDDYKSLKDKSLQEAIRGFFESLILHNHHPKMLVEHTLGYLSASRNGLSESEIVEVLSSDHIVIQDISNPFHQLPIAENINRLPAAVWSRLYYDLLKYLTYVEFDGVSLINFYHRKIKENSRNYFYMISKEFFHSNLLEYFWNQPLVYSENKITNLRKLSELPHHCINSRSYSKFIELYSRDFIKEKLSNGQKENMLHEIYEASTNLLDNKEIAEEYKDELISKIVHSLFSFLISDIKDTSSTVISVEDIHATYIFKTDTNFYSKFLTIVTDTEKLSQMYDDNILLKSYVSAFKARLGNMLRREARLEDASALYEEIISSDAIKTLHNLEQSTILYDVGAIAYLRGDPEKSLKSLQESADVAGDLNHEISRYMSLVKHGQVRFVYYEDYDFFENILDKAFELFWKFRLTNLSARRFVRNIYALYFDLYYAKKDLPNAIKYLNKFKSDTSPVYKSIYYIPKDASSFEQSHCTGYTPYEARIKILEKNYSEAADMFKRYIYDFMDDSDRITMEFIAKEYFDYLIALKQSNRMDEYEQAYNDAMDLPNEPVNAIWKSRIMKNT